MEEKRNDLVKEVFQEALEKPEAERPAFVESACEGDEGVRERVMALLAAYPGTEGFLDSPVKAVGGGARPEEARAAGSFGYVGTTIGRYKVLQLIGEGGFGAVYMAEQQEPIRRRVALKLIKLGMDTRQVVARFEAERQALAMMEHPNIARVLDAGATDSGRPYFVMELVKGVPITEYCDEHCLGTRERLELFADVCGAVQHAHQKGVVHRDLKPSNVLVTQHGGRPLPKVIDFGVARATGPSLTERTLFTEFGQFIGTPIYMSPEQAATGGSDIDTRSDIYSLGVLLYELLTGTTPFTSGQLRNVAHVEILRVLREVDPPPPSTRLSQLGESGTTVARLRGAGPNALEKLLRGDLDWIVMKALEKDRTRRYGSASELAADIGRYFGGDPVSAGPPDLGYRIRKLVRKNRARFAAAAAVAAAIVVGGSAATWQAVRASAAAQHARANAVFAYAASTEDPLLKALLVDEIADGPELPGKLAVLRDAANHPFPVSVVKGPDLANHHTYSPDGRYAAAAFMDGTAWVWPTDGTEAPRVLPHDDEVYHVVFSPDSRSLATGTSNGVVRIWSLAGGDPIVLHAAQRIGYMSFSPDGQLISAGTEQGGPVWIWRTDGSGEPVVIEDTGHLLSHPQDGLLGGAFLPDGEHVLVWQHDVGIWRTDGTGPTATFPGDWEEGSVWARMSPDAGLVWSMSDRRVDVYRLDEPGWTRRIEHGDRGATTFNGYAVATATDDGIVKIWDLDGYLDGSGNPTTLRHPAGGVLVVLSRTDRRVYTAQRDGRIRVWTSDGGTPEMEFAGPGGYVWLTEGPDGRRILAYYRDGTLREWALSRDAGEAIVLRHDEPVHAVAFHPDGRQLATGGDDGVVRIWSSDGAGGAVPLRGHGRFDGEFPTWAWHSPRSVGGVSFSPDGSKLLSASWDGTARIWPLTDSESPVVFEHGARVLDAAFGPDGQVVTAGADNRVLLWPSQGSGGAPSGPYPIRSPEPPAAANLVTEHGWWVDHVSIGPEGRRVLSTSEVARINDLVGESGPVEFRGHYEVGEAAFSPNGEQVALGAELGDLRIFPTTSQGEPILTKVGDAHIRAVSFSPAGERVAVGAVDGSVWVWRLDGSEDPIRMTGHTEGVTDVAFSPDGTRVASASIDGTVRIWRVTWDGLLEYVRSNLNTCLSTEQRVQYLAESRRVAREGAMACDRRLQEAGGR